MAENEAFGFGPVGCAYQGASKNCNRNAENGSDYCESHTCSKQGCKNQKSSTAEECGKGNCGGSTPPAYSAGGGRGSVKKAKEPGTANAADNNPANLTSEEIRTKDRTLGYRTTLGKGDQGGKTGGIEGKRSTVDQMKSTTRPTLIVMQPGQPRAKDPQYVPFLTPTPKSAPGHILFSMDVPPVAGKKGKQTSGPARRIIINQNQGKGAQISIEEYTGGSKAQKGKLGPKKTIWKDDGSMIETQDWIPATAKAAACREVIRVESFNLQEVQRCMTSQTVMSTLAEKEIKIRKTRTADETTTSWLPLGWVKLCMLDCWTDVTKPSCCGNCCCGIPERAAENENLSKIFDKRSSMTGEVHTVDGELSAIKVDQTKKSQHPEDACCCCRPMWERDEAVAEGKFHTKQTDDDNPFDMVNVSRIKMVLRSTIMSNADDQVELTWRVQSVGETETDLKYSIAPELKGPCQDPTSTARTLANVIHYLNA